MSSIKSAIDDLRYNLSSSAARYEAAYEHRLPLTVRNRVRVAFVAACAFIIIVFPLAYTADEGFMHSSSLAMLWVIGTGLVAGLALMVIKKGKRISGGAGAPLSLDAAEHFGSIESSRTEIPKAA